MSIIPQTGEQLPDYDDSPADGDIEQMCAWLKTRRGWDGEQVALAGYRASQTVRDVLAALQAVGDATLVKNSTYRLMRRDGADIERLAAYLTREGYAGPLVEHGGNPVTTIIAVIGDDQAEC